MDNELAFNSEIIGRQVRAKRAYLGLSQTDAAKVIGCHVGTIRRVESGKGVTMETLSKLINWLFTKVD